VTTLSAIPMLPPDEAEALLGSGPLPTRPYIDPIWFEHERAAIFKRHWLHVGHLCEITEAGSFIRRELEFVGASLLIVRGKDGKVRAFHNVCTHRGTQLVDEASGKTANFRCRYHSWSFGTDGKLLSAPDFERFSLDKSDCALKQVHVETCAGLVFVNFAPEPAQTLREFLGAIADELETLPVARATQITEYGYEIDANWKTNFDNFQENYHLRFIHPNTGAAALGEGNPFGYPVSYGFLGPHRSQTLWKSPTPPELSPVLKEAMTRAIGLAKAEGNPGPKVDYKLFPALHLVGQAAYFFSHTMVPVAHNKTRGTFRFYWTDKDDSASRRFTREFTAMSTRDVHCEDRMIVEAAQRGLSSGAASHVHFQTHEMLPRHLYETATSLVNAWLVERTGNPPPVR
jgi:phenylpropionate dioxygenase-like ring-hydroxylating dioxygenase large terminal subunit